MELLKYKSDQEELAQLLECHPAFVVHTVMELIEKVRVLEEQLTDARARTERHLQINRGLQAQLQRL